MQQRGMAHVALKSSDWQRSLDFYTRICGFDIRHRWRMPNGAHAAMLSAPDGGAMLELFDAAADVPAQGRRAEPGEEPVQGALLHLAFRVDDVDAAYAAALNWGATSFRAPVTVSLGDEAHAVRNAMLNGPGGEIVEFINDEALRR